MSSYTCGYSIIMGGVTANLITQDLSNVVLKNSVLKFYVGLNELKQDKYVKLKN